jgi:NAD(P)-dependent dehydrogenase (short-subunit alcohol dehydrogenase family)
VSLVGKTCVVTGASRGFGRAVADHLARRGATLALCARTNGDLEATATALRSHGGSVVTASADVSDEEAVRRFAATVATQVGAVHALVNNAGILGPVGRVDQLDLSGWQRALLVNTLGVVHSVAAFAPLMAESGGAVINLSGGGIGGPGIQANISAYTASKAAVVSLTETLAVELAPLRIRVNAIAPGALATDLMRPVLAAGPERSGDRLHETAQQLYEDAADGPIVLDERCSALLDYLLDDESRPLTGRLLSARWDSVEALRAEAARLAGSSKFTLRRIDGQLFVERPDG